jgi:AcrR family transcriptional regulator
MKVRTDAKRDEIVEVARAAFLELGYERTSMAEIATRVGGSKATLYGYFPSKEALLLATIERLGEQYITPALEQLTANPEEDVRTALRRFGEQFLAFISTQEAVASYRMVISQAGHSDIGEAFFEAGPNQMETDLARYLSGVMERGQLRKADADIAATHFLALLTHGEMWRHYFMYKLPVLTRPQIRRIVDRALDAFLAGYQPGAR